MQLNITTDYASRILIYLATVDRLASAQEIASNMGIPGKYIATVMQKLKKHGYVDSQQGNSGGYFLAKDPKDINLYDVFYIMEEGVSFSRCDICRPTCFLHEEGRECPINNAYVMTETVIKNTLSNITIEELSRNHKQCRTHEKEET